MDIQPPVACYLRAFTLIELIVVLAMVSIVLSVGVPGIHHLAVNSRITTAVNSMARHLHYARSEAIMRNIPVVLCPSRQGIRCDNSYHWENGFILFADRNGDRKRSDGEKILRHFDPGGGQTSIFTSTGRKKLTYQASGMAPGSTATITICDPSSPDRSRAIIVSNPGRPRLSNTRADGSPLNCI